MGVGTVTHFDLGLYLAFLAILRYPLLTAPGAISGLACAFSALREVGSGLHWGWRAGYSP